MTERRKKPAIKTSLLACLASSWLCFSGISHAEDWLELSADYQHASNSNGAAQQKYSYDSAIAGLSATWGQRWVTQDDHRLSVQVNGKHNQNLDWSLLDSNRLNTQLNWSYRNGLGWDKPTWGLAGNIGLTDSKSRYRDSNDLKTQFFFEKNINASMTWAANLGYLLQRSNDVQNAQNHGHSQEVRANNEQSIKDGSRVSAGVDWSWFITDSQSVNLGLQVEKGDINATVPWNQEQTNYWQAYLPDDAYDKEFYLVRYQGNMYVISLDWSLWATENAGLSASYQHYRVNADSDEEYNSDNFGVSVTYSF